MSKKFTFKSKLIDGNYPNYNQVVPQGEGSKITFRKRPRRNCKGLRSRNS